VATYCTLNTSYVKLVWSRDLGVFHLKESLNLSLVLFFQHSGWCILFAQHVLIRQAHTLFAMGLKHSVIACTPV
jgi:hypothetical protein